MSNVTDKNYNENCASPFPDNVYCSKCRRFHAPPVCVQVQYDVANIIFALIIMVGIVVYLPIVQRMHVPAVGTPPVTPTVRPAPGGAWLDPTPTVVVTPTP